MYLMLDHDNFLQSRKALMVTSATVLLLHNLDIKGSVVELSGLTLNLDRGVLVGFTSLFLLYFFAVFIIRGLEYSQSFGLANAEREANKANQSSPAGRALSWGEVLRHTFRTGFRSSPVEVWQAEHRFRDNLLYRYRLFVAMLIDVGVPIIFAVLTISVTGSFGAAGAFLDLL